MFQDGKFTSHSGLELDYKLECDSLTDADWKCIAELVARKVQFKRVVGIPTGGTKLATLLMRHAHEIRLGSSDGPVLVVDDVLTTGDSFREAKARLVAEGENSNNIVGVVLYARGPCPWWVTPVFCLGLTFRNAVTGIG